MSAPVLSPIMSALLSDYEAAFARLRAGTVDALAARGDAFTDVHVSDIVSALCRARTDLVAQALHVAKRPDLATKLAKDVATGVNVLAHGRPFLFEGQPSRQAYLQTLANEQCGGACSPAQWKSLENSLNHPDGAEGIRREHTERCERFVARDGHSRNVDRTPAISSEPGTVSGDPRVLQHVKATPHRPAVGASSFPMAGFVEGEHGRIAGDPRDNAADPEMVTIFSPEGRPVLKRRDVAGDYLRCRNYTESPPAHVLSAHAGVSARQDDSNKDAAPAQPSVPASPQNELTALRDEAGELGVEFEQGDGKRALREAIDDARAAQAAAPTADTVEVSR